jgi:hypothetical protein
MPVKYDPEQSGCSQISRLHGASPEEADAGNGLALVPRAACFTQ